MIPLFRCQDATARRQEVAMAEIRPIPGFPGYAVGEDGTVWTYWRTRRDVLGRVRSYVGQRRHKMKPSPNVKSGHLSVGLWRGGTCRRIGVHVLVLTAFVGPCPPRMEGRHLNGDPADCCLSNLQWSTKSQNNKDRIAHGTDRYFGDRHWAAVLSVDLVSKARRLAVDGLTHDQIASELGGFNRATVSDAIIGKTWAHVAEPPPVPSRRKKPVRRA